MRFSFERDVLTSQIAIAQEIITNKSAQSVLSNVLLESSGGTLTIKATDSAVNFITHISVNVEEEGSVIVYCDKLMSILQSLPAGEVDFESEESNVVIRPVGRKLKFCLKSMGVSLFPPIDTARDVEFFDIGAKVFLDMIKQVSFAVSNDANRYFMTGVYFAKEDVEGVEGKKLVMTATDGRRLALMYTDDIDKDFNGSIVPTKILSCILHTAPSEGNIAIGLTDKMMVARFGGYEFSSMLIDGEFPNYHKVIPSSQTHRAKILKADFETALKRMMIMIDKHSSRLCFKFTPGALTVFSVETEFGTSEEEIPCEYDGEEMTIALNCHFLADPLKAMSDQNIIIEFTESMRAITLRGDGEDNYFHVIMPMNL